MLEDVGVRVDLAITRSFMLETTREMSFVASRLPIPISSPRHIRGRRAVKKPDPTLRVDGLQKIIASVWHDEWLVNIRPSLFRP